METATRESWQHSPMPESCKPLAWSRTFPPEEREVIARGLIPRQMEDKWFIYQEADQVFFHRSWTGLCCYRLDLGRRSAWYNPEDDELSEQEHVALLEFLIDRLLLDKPVSFPLFQGQENRAMAIHSVVGYADSSAPRKPLRPDKAGLELSRARLEASGCELIAYGCKANGEMKGGPSAPLLLAAGAQLQESLREKLAKTSRDLGEVVLTPSYKMRELMGIFHIVALKKDLAGNWISELEPLAAGMRKTLELCRELRAHSVAFAALGATKLTVAPEGAARFMTEAAREYQRKNPDWPMRILFCLPDHNVYQAFLKRMG